MQTQRIWVIAIDSNTYYDSFCDGQSQIFFIGYENGQKVRKKEIYFSQREKDKDFYQMQFRPEPQFISYSFFLGFFEETLRNLCVSDVEERNDSYLARKKELLNKFLKKYVFKFKTNPKLENTIKDYVDAIIEEIVDDVSKGVKK